jgi:2-phospho-L-lactate transferase/gluconeogenesis factor (CofD/UPF0052 family)
MCSDGLYLTQGNRARLFTGSLESAIYLLSNICAIPSTVATLPAINSNFTHHISAGLADGSCITGQNAISHPSAPTSLPDTGDAAPLAAAPTTTTTTTATARAPHDDAETEAHDRIEDATLPGSLPSLRKQYIEFSKAAAGSDDLPARIERIWYINPYGHEIWPLANPKVVSAIEQARAVIYSIGSLYTSLVPSLVLRGVGRAIADSGVRHKILILNSTLDRETGPSTHPLTATDFVHAIARAGAESQGHFDAAERGAKDVGEVRRYLTHLLYLEGDQVPKVNKTELAALGVDCIRVYGRKVEGMLQYDEAGLARALEAIVGKAEMTRSRRNTSGQ